MIKLAWRNLWRNRRRTLITAASVFFAVFLAILMRGFKHGVWVHLIDNVLHSYTGYVQVHEKGYWDNKTFDYSMAANDLALDDIKKIKQVKGIIPRLESFSLASSGDKTKGVITVGIDPDLENEFTELNKKIVSGRYFTNMDTGVILSERLSKYLSLKVNDSIVLLSQGYQGMGANGIYKILGIVKLPSPEFDNQMVYMPLPLAQEYYSAQNRITSVVIDLKNPQDMEQVIRKINKVINLDSYEVMSWKEMLIELYQQYVSNEGSGMIIISLLYLIVGFGVFGTVLMMIAERRHEFGIMITVGMQRSRLMMLVGTELAFICIMGLFFGFLGSVPIVAYFHFYPIHMGAEMAKSYAAFGMDAVLPTAWQLDYMLQQVYIVFGIVLVVLIYPLYSVYKLDLTKAMRR
jgi:ABC-type lipoprotein release transport system permease subunit